MEMGECLVRPNRDIKSKIRHFHSDRRKIASKNENGFSFAAMFMYECVFVSVCVACKCEKYNNNMKIIIMYIIYLLWNINIFG